MKRSRSAGGGAVVRVLDVDLNRAREGLRVCEEVARFVLEDPRLTRRCRQIRYDLRSIAQKISPRGLLGARDSRRDVGRPGRRGRMRAHAGIRDLAAANSQRVQEALRVLEEFSRIGSPRRAEELGRLRFRVYSLEKDLLSPL